MSSRLSLIFKILGFIILVLAIAGAIWYVFFRSASLLPPVGEQPLEEQGQLPAIGEGFGGRVLEGEEGLGLRKLAPEQEIAPAGADVVATGGRTMAEPITPTRAGFSSLGQKGFNYYNESDQRFYRLSQSGGEPILLSDRRFPSVENVYWANAVDKAILEFPDGSNILYDFDNNEQVTLPRAGQEFTFSPNDSAIAYEYIGANEDDRWIVASDTRGQGQRLVQALGRESQHVKVDWSPTERIVATYREPTSSAGDEVFFIGLDGENFLSLQTNGLGFEGKWSPEGRQILYSVYSRDTNYNPVLHIAGADGDNIGANNRSIPLQTTPDKCAFAGEAAVYCAVPQFLEEGSGIFPELANSTPDTIYKIDLINNLTTVIAFPESDDRSSFTIDKLMVNPDESELFFTDKVTGRIRRIRLR